MRTYDRVLRVYAARAAEMIAARGFRPVFSRGREKNAVAWRDGHDIRTLVLRPKLTQPLIARIAMDYYKVPVSKRSVRILGLQPFYTDALLIGKHRAGDISVLPDEIDATIFWMLAQNAPASIDLTTCPFEPFRESEPWSCMISHRAALVLWAKQRQGVPGIMPVRRKAKTSVA